MRHRELPTPLSVGVDESARLIGVARSMMYEILARGDIQSFKVGRRRLILIKELEEFINRQAKDCAR
ncbi:MULTISPECIES: helix-turn-helix domain-containing protein [Pseudomonas]|uniref:helix-turn-helix domain-containing protein n=1 Tax=Pseudomonas TaxID=286 RepID=UPI00056EFC0A|nr:MULTISPECIES: helix-turn-helix domain-containing protein [Pseudomonas]QUN68450.1 helix-turn-helix domain-containing protein [Pseudomonas sp. JS425]